MSYLKNHMPTRMLTDKTPFKCGMDSIQTSHICMSLSASSGYMSLVRIQRSTADPSSMFLLDTLTTQRPTAALNGQLEAAIILHRVTRPQGTLLHPGITVGQMDAIPEEFPQGA